MTLVAGRARCEAPRLDPARLRRRPRAAQLRRWPSSGRPACAAPRSTSSRPGRRCCSRSGCLLVLARRAAGPLRFRPSARRLARARLRRARRRLGAHPAALARRRRDPPRRRARRPPRPASGRRVLLRPRARPDVRDARRLGVTILGAACAVAAFGLIDIYAIPLSWWRSSGAPGWFTKQLGFTYKGLSNLPENFVYNTGNEHPLRRLVSIFLSPLAASYMFVTALLLAAAWCVQPPAAARWSGCRRPALALRRAPLDALAQLLPRARARARRLRGRCGRSGGSRSSAPRSRVVVVGLAFVKAYPHIAPETSFTAARARTIQQQLARATRPAPARRSASAGSRTRAPRAISAEPPRRDQDRPPPPAGLRPRQRRLDRGAHERHDQGRRVDLHRARRRRRARRRAALRRLVARRARPALPLHAPGSAPRSSRCSRSGCRPTSSACPGSSTSSGRSPAGACPTRDLSTPACQTCRKSVLRRGGRAYRGRRADHAPRSPRRGCRRSVSSPRATSLRGGHGATVAGRAREPDAHAGLAQPRRHPGDDRLDDLRPRLDDDRPAAVRATPRRSSSSRCRRTASAARRPATRRIT